MRVSTNPATLLKTGVIEMNEPQPIDLLTEALQEIVSMWCEADSENSLAFEMSEIARLALRRARGQS